MAMSELELAWERLLDAKRHLEAWRQAGERCSISLQVAEGSGPAARTYAMARHETCQEATRAAQMNLDEVRSRWEAIRPPVRQR